jgi:hypothetical protein
MSRAIACTGNGATNRETCAFRVGIVNEVKYIKNGSLIKVALFRNPSCKGNG